MNPATGETLRVFEPLTSAQIEERLARAETAYRLYRRTPLAERRRWLLAAAGILESEQDRLGRIMTLEMGKTIAAARAEAAKCATACRYYAEHGERLMADEAVEAGAGRNSIRYQPIGPVLAVMPWNFPFWQVFRFAAPALMAGNVGLLKHASNVPQCALAIEDVIRPRGFPGGRFSDAADRFGRVGRVLDDPRVQAASLTGSEPAGAQVAAQAGKRIKKTVLEFGGSDPFIVMPSADFEAAVRTAVEARTINNGQSCIAAKRFIVHREIAGEFERRFTGAMEALRVGDPMDETTQVGPLATPDILGEPRRAGAAQRRDGRAAAHRRPPAGAARELLRAHRTGRCARDFARCPRGDVRPGSRALPRERPRRKPSRWPMTPNSAWAPAPGRAIPRSNAASRTKSRPAWSSSTPWWPPTRACRSAA